MSGLRLTVGVNKYDHVQASFDHSVTIYSFEQGLSRRRPTCDDIFVPGSSTRELGRVPMTPAMHKDVL